MFVAYIHSALETHHCRRASLIETGNMRKAHEHKLVSTSNQQRINHDEKFKDELTQVKTQNTNMSRIVVSTIVIFPVRDIN